MSSHTQQHIDLQSVKDRLERLGYGVYPLKSPSASKGLGLYENIWQLQDAALMNRAESGQLYGFEALLEDRQASLTQFLMLQEAWVIVLPYALKAKTASDLNNREAFGQVSIMSWEWDYHTTIQGDVRHIIESLNMPHTCYQLQVDSGPWPERRLATLAGAGKVGRNQMLLNEAFGGANYLGILGWRSIEPIVYETIPQPLDLALLSDSSTMDKVLSENCKGCQLCQQACPGTALIGKHDFLPTRCISALTQVKRPLTDSEMRLLGDQLYGCDICQQVCPANAVQSNCQPRHRETAPEIDVFVLLTLSQKQFKQVYGHHGFAWRGLKILKRNALIHLGNSGNSRAYEFLHRLGNEKIFEGELESVRLWALSRIQERLNHDKLKFTISE